MDAWVTHLLSLSPRYAAAYTVMGISLVTYAGFWAWGLSHAATTPKANSLQRSFWVGTMLVNPSTTIWYWYIWKRWAFWLLFTPLLLGFLSAPLVVRSLLTKAEATAFTNTLYALGNSRIVIWAAVLMIFPVILRLATLLHLGRNTEMDAMRRNDWVVSFAFPIYGLGASLAYAARYMRPWALAALGWWVAASWTAHSIIPNIVQALIPAGEERREEVRGIRTKV